jgi:hypothetical protein
MGKVGSFLTCSIHWLLFGEWRSLSLLPSL